MKHLQLTALYVNIHQTDLWRCASSRRPQSVIERDLQSGISSATSLGNQGTHFFGSDYSSGHREERDVVR
eukprot:CAMPEP_0182431488 /NCGR_PEP_ID=MMETSP1167-20130531/49619_1 /TAXON_ID=2988 /ORGANISM="Mallomonas Sp, Strain CCMP3275" /LENGTH=69 /DNA_ID=CAMNT_0024617891 /DNA_START=57 /DNA_END=266 /DNA_ORIENTATION=+